VSPVKYELGFYIPEDDILHSHCRENLRADIDSYLCRCLYVTWEHAVGSPATAR
jgi:hypothetical protein